MRELEKQLCLDVSSGAIESVSVQDGITVKGYFTSLSILNQSAHIYGKVYMATPEALGTLTGELK